MELQGCGVAGFEALREGAAVGVGEELLGGPEGDCGRSGPGTLQTDLAKMELGRAEIGVRRVVFIEAPDRRIMEEHAAAAIGLQAMLMRVDHERVDLADPVVQITADGPGVAAERLTSTPL